MGTKITMTLANRLKKKSDEVALTGTHPLASCSSDIKTAYLQALVFAAYADRETPPDIGNILPLYGKISNLLGLSTEECEDIIENFRSLKNEDEQYELLEEVCNILGNDKSFALVFLLEFLLLAEKLQRSHAFATDYAEAFSGFFQLQEAEKNKLREFASSGTQKNTRKNLSWMFDDTALLYFWPECRLTKDLRNTATTLKNEIVDCCNETSSSKIDLTEFISYKEFISQISNMSFYDTTQKELWKFPTSFVDFTRPSLYEVKSQRTFFCGDLYYGEIQKDDYVKVGSHVIKDQILFEEDYKFFASDRETYYRSPVNGFVKKMNGITRFHSTEHALIVIQADMLPTERATSNDYYIDTVKLEKQRDSFFNMIDNVIDTIEDDILKQKSSNKL